MPVLLLINVANVNNIKIPLVNLQTQKKIVKYLKLAHKETQILQNLAAVKQKYHKSVFENLIKK